LRPVIDNRPLPVYNNKPIFIHQNPIFFNSLLETRNQKANFATKNARFNKILKKNFSLILEFSTGDK